MSELGKEKIIYFGAPGGSRLATTTINSTALAFISFNQFLGENNSQNTIENIWKAKKVADFVAVYAHWGEEYGSATDYQKALAHSFIDAGADMVIGSHPHVIQEKEIYKNKPIYYSIGNFIFDQYWMESVRTGGGVEVGIESGDINDVLVKFDLKRDGTVCRANS